MSYCTVSDVRSRNPLLLSSSSVSDAVISDYIDYAGGIIDGYLSSRYSLPFTTTPAIVKGICADLAGAEALGGTVGNTGTDEQPNQAVYLRKNAMALLASIADGKITAGLPSTDESNVSAQAIYGGRRKRSDFARWDPMNPKPPRRHNPWHC